MPSPQNREEMLVAAALEMPVEKRPALLDAVCLGDPALRQRLESLLAAQQKTDPSPTPAAPTVAATLKLGPPDAPDEAIGTTIRRYKLLEIVGEGGCGVVYVAEQTQPVRRRVALKVIKLGMDTKQVVARFEAERQALAMMDHPNIAKVLDGGSTESGRPYFVMELVRGIRITDYCDQNHLTTQERLDLFIKVCHAIQHAHQKGIIHRDIKPSNILVTLHDGVPVPKVIDFGIAKATEGRLTDATVYTQLNQFIGTPAYMSPEQAEMSGLDIDTRSDIYSLGVLLYELLAGSTPFDATELMSQGIDAMRKRIRETEPPRPSTRFATLKGQELTTTAKRRSADKSKLMHQLQGDLDWIVMKCLEKDRTRRYETANGLAADLKRHLNNEPVTARPPSRLYELQKSIRRHKVGFAAAAAIIIILAIGIAASVDQAVRAQHETARARSAEQRAVAAFDQLRATAPAFADQARSLAATERFDDAIEKLNYAVKLRPDVADYLLAKGDLLQCQFKLVEAAAAYRAALRVQPGLARAEASAKLCDELLAAKPNDQGKLARESLAKLLLVMQQQQRPAAELMPVARLLGKEKELLLDYWLARLKDLPISADYPLAKRLTVRDDGRLALDLSGTKVTDLSPLAGAPLAALDVSKSKDLTDLSPLRGLDLIELNLSATSVADLTPLREMRNLEKLNLSGTKVTDLAPLHALRLDDLDLDETRTFEISALRGMNLKKLSLRDTRVADLSPLAGMPLTFLDATSIPAGDYAPLAGAPLEECIIQNSPMRDLSFLRDSPVKELVLFNCNEARGFEVLAGLKSLDLLILPQSFRGLPAEELAAIGALRTHPTLRNIQTEYRSGGGWVINTTQSKDVFWREWDREQGIVEPLSKKGVKFSLTKLPDGTYYVNLDNSEIRDLAILSNAPISQLSISHTAVADLKPLRGMALKKLWLFGTKVTDLSPLEGMPIDTLNLGGTKVSDLSALRGMPLVELSFLTCPEVIDFSPLAGVTTLKLLTLPAQARNFDFLRALPRLERIGYGQDTDNGYRPDKTAAEFWADYDAKKK